MRKKKNIILFLCNLVLIGCLWLPKELKVSAQEVVVPGYHEYVETEDEKIDHWYGIARGTYLKDGTCGIKDAGKGKVSVSGITTAHSVCDTVRVGIYLDESSDGGKSFGQIGSYYFSEQNTSSCYGNRIGISVTSGWHYMARGGHSAIKGSVSETTTTRTGVLKAS